MTWVRSAQLLYDTYGGQPHVNNFWVYPPLPSLYWYLNRGIEQDVLPGLVTLKRTLMDESEEELATKTQFTWYLCGGAWGLMVAGLLVLTLVLNKQREQIDQAPLGDGLDQPDLARCH